MQKVFIKKMLVIKKKNKKAAHSAIKMCSKKFTGILIKDFLIAINAYTH